MFFYAYYQNCQFSRSELNTVTDIYSCEFNLFQFWSALSPRAQHELLRLDKQTLIEHARKNLYCSRCNGLLLESFTQIVMYGKSLLHEGSCEPRIQEVEAEEVQDPSVHPWGGLSTTKDGILTLLDCFINAKSLHVIQNVRLKQ